MIVRSLLVRYGQASQINSDRHLVSHHHHHLIENCSWDCSSPSRALAVLGVLVRSGTLVGKLDKAASGALNAMAPSMTGNEQILLNKLSSFLGLKGVVDSNLTSNQNVELGILNVDVNNEVLKLYSQFISNQSITTSLKTKSITFSSDSVLQLNAITSLMLLEMTLSRSFPIESFWKDESVVGALFDRLRFHIMYSSIIKFKAIWWVLDILNDTQSPLYNQPIEGGRLFRACLRRINEMLPELSNGECLLVLPLLYTSVYERPFIICADIIKRLISCDLEELNIVPTCVVLQVLGCDGLSPEIIYKLCQMLQKDLRIAEFGKEECLVLLSTLATQLLPFSEFKNLNKDKKKEYDCLYESLFAQIYLNAKTMNTMECVKTLEYLELIRLSNVSIFISSDLLERLKKRALVALRLTLKRSTLNIENLEVDMESLRRLERVLKRCTLLPFLENDAIIISDFFRKLTCQMKIVIKDNQ